MSSDRPFFGDQAVGNTDLEVARIVVIPFCYEHAPSYGAGSAQGPLWILEASTQLESIDEETLTDWGRLAVHTAAPVYPTGDPQAAVRQMQARAAEVISSGRFLLSLGGDHAVSIGPIAAAAAAYPELGVVQVDAHLDLRDTWNGSRYNHACVMRRVRDDLSLPVVQIGIRSFSAEEAAYVKAGGLEPFYAHEIDGAGEAWIARVVERLPEKVYLTVDLDGLDPAVVPGTGTPEPGGLSYRQLVRLIRAIGRSRTVVAADITELVKIDGTQVSEFTAAKIATKMFVHLFDRPLP